MLQGLPHRWPQTAPHLSLIHILLSLLDVLVDGEFVQAKHDISLRFRGSSNQRLLDVKKTLAAGQPVWWEDEKVFATHTMEK